MKEQKLNQLRKKIISAVPEVFIEGCQSGKKNCNCWWCKTYPPDGNKWRDITLEDVLVALEDVIWGRKFYLFEIWRLNKPLHEQSKETINFLNDLI